MIIALLTDFGTQDYFVGAMKGAILSINPDATIVDITHEIPPQDVRSAAFTLSACYKDFPAKTIVVAVVDPGVGSARKAILVETEKYFFIAPDNGLLSFVMDEGRNASANQSAFDVDKTRFLTVAFPSVRVIDLTNKKYFAEDVSSTFHGRDIFAPVAAHLSNGVQPREFGDETNDFIQLETAKPRSISAEKIEAEIIHVDRFGNLITNLRAKDLPEKFVLEINEKRIERHLRFYAEAESGEIFSISGSAGFLEIAAKEISASKLLNAKTGVKVFLTKMF
jgi:S-adenosylmethionine hydrolase